MKNRIIVPTDFTKASGKAVKQAIIIAKRAGFSLTLFHVLDDASVSGEEIGEKMKADAESILQQSQIKCEVLILRGNVLEMIAQTISEKDYDLMVIGTHGANDLRQKIFGADILKLVAKVAVPVLVMQEDSQVVESFNKIVLPVASHENFEAAVQAVLLFAGIFDLEVHFYSIHKRGFEWPMQMLANIEEATRIFEEKNVRMVRIREEQNDFSQGYARQTLRYARSIGADTMWMMSVPSQEYYYMAKAYKEALLLNDNHLPMLCAGGGAAG